MSRVSALLRIAYSILKIVGSLLSAWILISWNVRKARRSFEAEMMKAGVSKEDAQKLSECFVILKDQMKSLMKSPMSLEIKYLKKR